MAKEYKGRLTGSQIDALYDQVQGKQNEIVVMAKDNGNVVLRGIGVSDIELMPATPSGDPLHYAYIAAGAVWNPQTGYWEYRAQEGGLADLTNEDMRICYSEAWLSSAVTSGVFYNMSGRTTINKMVWTSTAEFVNAVRGSNVEVAFIKGGGGAALPKNLLGSFWFCPSLKKIIGTIDAQYASSSTIEFRDSPMLQVVSLKGLKTNVDLSHNPLISKSSVRDMIRNAAPTKAITIKLALEPYLNLATDADIVSDLSAQPLITLIS